MKTDQRTGAGPTTKKSPSGFFPSVSRMILSVCVLGVFAGSGLHAATINATYNSAFDVPIATPSYTATGNTVQFALNFTPSTGTRLTVVHNTGLNFIQGRFDNLAHGQTVILTYGGVKYYFTANYYGNSGRDLVLQWTNMKPFAWGAGTTGQLGNTTTADSPQAVSVHAGGAFWGKLASSGAAGGGHSVGLCADGTVASWGKNDTGQLGDNSTTPSAVPVAVTGGTLAGKTVVAVAAGVDHSIALCSDGKVAAWGLNGSGQLGDGSTTQRNVPVNVSTSGVLSGKTVVAISAGAYHCLALSSEGTVFSWGLNTNGQLGNNSTTQSSSPVAITGGVLAGKTVVAIAAGGYHSLAYCTDGTLAAWGLNTSGQLGDSSTTQRNTPVAVTRTTGALLGKTITMIAAGGNHSLAVCSDGTLTAWGSNTSGQLGTGNNNPSILPAAVSQSGVLNGKSVFLIGAGASHSFAQCTDGKVATWGMGTSGQLGNNTLSNINIPVLMDESALNQSGFAGVASGPAANHSLALVASPETDISHCGYHKQFGYTQSSSADPVLNPDSPYSFHSYISPGQMGVPLASSTITPPAGGTGTALYESGSDGLQIFRSFNTKAEMDAAYPSGTYLMTIRTSTPNTYQVSLPLADVNYPPVPKITGFTNATWNNGVLKITDPASPVTLTWSNPSNDDTWFQIDNTPISKNDSTPSTGFTIPANSLDNNTLYRASLNLINGSSNAAVPGAHNAWSNSSHQVRLEFLIEVGTTVSDESPMYLLLKNHNQVQTSNSDPVDAPNPLPDADLAPYSMTVESPVGGTLSGPAGTSFPLNFHPDSDGAIYEYYSPPLTSSAALNTNHPNGTYTFPGGISATLTGDVYPATAKVLTVNGATPVWNAQGQLALDPTMENTIVWSAVTVPDFSIYGHQGVYFEGNRDFNFTEIEIERGGLSSDPSAPAVTTLTIPKFAMTPTFTYIGYIGYAKATSMDEPEPGVFAVGAYETSNQFMVVALRPQTLTFAAMTDKTYPGAAFDPGATLSSGLPVTYEVVSGRATVSGGTVTLVGTGTVTLRARHEGNGEYASAPAITHTFTVNYASKLAEFRANNGLAVDGSEDLLTPAGEGVPNLLKFAFNMIGTGPGQTSSLNVSNVQTVGLSGNAGLPRQGANSGKLTITYIRRKASSSPGVTYSVEFSNTMSVGSWGVNDSATESVAEIDAEFERVTVTDNSAYPKRFARVRVAGN